MKITLLTLSKNNKTGAMKFLIFFLFNIVFSIEQQKKSRAFKDRCKKQCGYLIYLFCLSQTF